MSESLEAGKVSRCRIEGPIRLDYFVYLPVAGQVKDRVMISVHGISRNAEDHLHGFTAQAEQHGVIMIAPLFPEVDYPRYQRLGTSVREGRADLAFDQIMQDARERLRCNPFPLRIFGFSGGGQFSHRYALFNPKRIRRMVLAAPGWYTFPDPDKSYPLGLRSSRDWPKLHFSPADFLQIPTLVLVGEQDNIRDEDLNKSRRIECFQGLDRCERGERWVNAQRALSRAHGLLGDFRFEIIPNASHAFESYQAHPQFAEQVFNFLFDE